MLLSVLAWAVVSFGFNRGGFHWIVRYSSLKHLACVFEFAIEFDWATISQLVAPAALGVPVLLVATVVCAAGFAELWLGQNVLVVVGAAELVLGWAVGPLLVLVAAGNHLVMVRDKSWLSLQGFSRLGMVQLFDALVG